MAWIEQVERRSQKAKHYYNPETGQFRAEFTIHDRHYRDNNGHWQDVDENLTDDTTPGFAKRCDKTRHIFRVGQGGERRWYPRRDVLTEYVGITGMQFWSDAGGGRWLPLNLPAALWNGNKAEWTRQDMTITVTNTWRRVKLEIKLLSSDAPVRMRFATEFVGLILDGWDVKSGADVVGRIDPITAQDANDNTLPATMVWDGEYIEWSVDTTGAAYPITVDPTFTDGYGGDVATAQDTYLVSSNSDKSYGDRTDLSASPCLVLFDLSSIDAGATCTSATLSLYNFETKTSNRDVVWYSLLSGNSGWVEGIGADPATSNQSTWDYKNQTGTGAGTAWAGSAGASTSGTDYNGTSIGTNNYVANDAVGTESQASLTTSVIDDWFGATNTNYGLLGLPSFQGILWCASDHATTDYRPSLVVDYTAAAAGNPYYAYAQQ